MTQPLNHLVVSAYPAPGFGHAVVDRYVETVRAEGQTATVRDLYAIGFDPVLTAAERPGPIDWAPAADVEAELALVSAADILVLVYPIWYGLPPAMIKGYVDRVLGAGYSFRDFEARRGQPALVGKPLLSFSTSGMPFAWLDERSQVLSLREIFDVYLWRGFGMRQSEHVMLDSVIPHLSPQDARSRLDEVSTVAARTCRALVEERSAGHEQG